MSIPLSELKIFCFGWYLLHVLLIHSSLGVFLASKLDFVPTTGLPSFDNKTLEVLHANELHEKVVGRAAERVLKSFEETLTDNNTLDEKLREKFYKTRKEEAVKSHTNEMRKALKDMRASCRIIKIPFSTSQVKFFPGIALIGIGMRIGLGKLVCDGITGLIHRFSEEEQRHKREMNELIEMNKKVQDLEKSSSSKLPREIRYSFVFSQVRTQILMAVEEAMIELFSRGRVTDLMSPERFEESLLKRKYEAAGVALQATVLSKRTRYGSEGKQVADFGSSCVTIASTLLCKTRPQPFKCGLASRRRRGCAFTLVESLLRTIVVATRMKRILYKSAERDTFESIRLEKPGFVCEIPNGAMIQIRVETITSRITSSNFLAVKKRPNPKDDSRDDNMDELSGRGGWWLNGERLVVLLMSVIIGLVTLKSLIYYQSSSKMAEPILRSKKYTKVVEIGNAAKENFERLKNEQIIRILPTEMKEGANFCVSGKQGEYRLYEHLSRALNDRIRRYSLEFKGHMNRRINRYEGDRRDEVEMLVREQIDAALRARGIHARAEAVSSSSSAGTGERIRGSTTAQMRKKEQEEEAGSDAAVSRQAARPQAAEEGLHDEPDVGEGPSTPPTVRPVTFAGENVPRHLLDTYFDDKLYEDGSYVPSVFRKHSKYDYMFHHELDAFDRDYYMESFTITVTQREGAWGRLDENLKFWRKLRSDAHPLLQQFAVNIRESLLDMMTKKGEPSKNGIWMYISYVERFMIVTMRTDGRCNGWCKVELTEVVGGPVQIRRVQARSKSGTSASRGRSSRKIFLQHIAMLNTEEKQMSSLRGIMPDSSKEGELYHVAQAVVDQAGVGKSVEKLMRKFERRGTLMGQVVTIDDVIYSSEIIVKYMHQLKTEGATVGVRQNLLKSFAALYKFVEFRIEARAGRQPLEDAGRERKIFLHHIAMLNAEEKQMSSLRFDALIILAIWKEDRQMLDDEKAVEPAQ
ncbi:unnamed protein product [Strongylus vulgaris]|uniref:Uncharacterized protein n=1 Tax=Strongylus vulgaris TaxID=40348 RepID=A0A3P7IS30_STRVU|nr:unnamed protein product [Strongylus vulgaris]